MAERYVRELVVRVEGDRDAAPAYLPAARTLMGMVLEQASVNDLGTHKLVRHLRDGTVLVAEKIGEINRVTIAPPPPGGRTRPVRVFDDVLALAGAAERDGGGNRVRPPVILSHDDEMRWRAYFASTDAPGYGSGAGTYSDVFPQVMDNEKRLYGGNCFNRNKDGLVTSWWSAAICMGPPARNPARVYSAAVFCLGMPLFDIIDAGNLAVGYNRVLAAAVHDGDLLVLLADLAELDYPLRPNIPEQEADAWASSLYSETANPTALLRYKLKTKVDPVSWHYHYEVDYDSGELLWSASLVRAYNRWTFDGRTGEFVSVQLPRQPVLLYRYAELADPLSADEVIFRLGADGLRTEPAGDIVYEEGGAQVRLVAAGATGLDFVTPLRRIPAVRLSETEVQFTGLLYANPVDDRYVLSNIRQETRTTGAVPFTGAHRAWLTALEAGEATEFSTTEPGTTSPCSGYYLLSKYLTDLAAGGSGISKGCHALCGWLFHKTPGRLTEGAMRVGLLNAAQIKYGIRGHAAGGLSVGGEPDIPGQPRRWSNTVYFGQALDTGLPTLAPVYDPEGYGVLLYATAVGSDQCVAAHREDSDFTDNTYITKGDFDDLTGDAFEVPYFSMLGKPHPEQPMERPA